MSDIHAQYLKFEKVKGGNVDYANIAGFINVADPMLYQGVV